MVGYPLCYNKNYRDYRLCGHPYFYLENEAYEFAFLGRGNNVLKNRVSQLSPREVDIKLTTILPIRKK